jgi:hypothetical protein
MNCDASPFWKRESFGLGGGPRSASNGAKTKAGRETSSEQIEGHTAVLAFAAASVAQASPCFCASFVRPGISDFNFAEVLDRSAAG